MASRAEQAHPGDVGTAMLIRRSRFGAAYRPYLHEFRGNPPPLARLYLCIPATAAPAPGYPQKPGALRLAAWLYYYERALFTAPAHKQHHTAHFRSFAQTAGSLGPTSMAHNCALYLLPKAWVPLTQMARDISVFTYR